MKACAAALLPLALGACSGGETALNNAAAAPPEIAGDYNLAIGGDEISPIPEGEDLIASNVTGNLAAPPAARGNRQ